MIEIVEGEVQQADRVWVQTETVTEHGPLHLFLTEPEQL
jgi:hypothetical protein